MADTNTRKELEDLLGRDDLTIEELLQSAEGLLRIVAPKQTRYKVTERPDVRTIRYYISQKLLPKPVSYQGGRARYAGVHLVRLLLIKKLQAEHHTLQQIKIQLKALDDQQAISKLAPVQAREEPALVSAPAAASAPVEQLDKQQTCVRFSLGDGCNLDLPKEVLEDEQRLSNLVRKLKKLTGDLKNRSSDED